MVCLIVEPKCKYCFVFSNLNGKCNNARVNAFFIFHQVFLQVTWNEETKIVMRSACNTDDLLCVLVMKNPIIILA
jgi:hypothetical protein